MKQYMLLIKSSGMPETGQSDGTEMIQKYIAWAGKLREEGRYVAADGVTDEVRLLKGSSSATERSLGNYGAQEGMVGGYYIYTAKDFDEAEQIARGCPALERGAVLELREQQDYS